MLPAMMRIVAAYAVSRLAIVNSNDVRLGGRVDSGVAQLAQELRRVGERGGADARQRLPLARSGR